MTPSRRFGYSKLRHGLSGLAMLLLLQACATSGALQVAREQFQHGSANDALKTLSEASVSSRDQLLLYLDRGLVAQAAGHYADSIIAFERALNLIDELDYVSLRDQSAALVTSDWATRYRGEYSERLWIHAFQMMNFLLLGYPESAAVEARRAVALYKEQGDVLQGDIFTRSLMALSFESAGQSDSARVEYKKLAEDFNESAMTETNRKDGELVLFIATGFIPNKLPGDLFIDLQTRISFPYYGDDVRPAPAITLTVNDNSLALKRADTALVTISKKALEQRGKTIAARQALRLAAKYNIADAIEEKDALAGGIAKLLLVAIEQADTRSWETLPAYLTLVRVPLSPGQHTVNVHLNDYAADQLVIDHERFFDISISAGERQFKLIRTGINLD